MRPGKFLLPTTRIPAGAPAKSLPIGLLKETQGFYCKLPCICCNVLPIEVVSSKLVSIRRQYLT